MGALCGRTPRTLCGLALTSRPTRILGVKPSTLVGFLCSSVEGLAVKKIKRFVLKGCLASSCSLNYSTMTTKRKIGVCSEIANDSKKIRRHYQGQNQDAMDVDTYRPEFPELVIYKVLKLLPTKLAVRASIVSSQWRRVWFSLPFLDFDEGMQLFKSEYGLDRKKFLKFLHSSLNCHKEDKQDLDMFRLRMRYSGGLRTIDKCLSFAIERKVKNLDISLRRRKKDRSKSYYLPGMILNNAKYLTSLSLANVKIKDETGPISLPSLKTMSLENMKLEHCNTFVQLFSCPSIEGLSLASCNLRHCKVSSSSLKSLHVTLCDNVVLEVEAMNLESLRFWGRSNGFPMHLDRHLKIVSCRSLRNLVFLDTQFVGRWFEDGLNPRFPLLESLILHKCRNSLSNTLEINSQHLKRLWFSAHDAYSTNAKIHTPNLDSFTLRTGGLPSDHLSAFVSTFSLHAPNLQDANIDFNFEGNDFSPLRNVLRHFNCSRKISLSANEAEALIFPEETRNTCLPPLPRVKHLEVALHSSPKVDNNVLMDSFKWMAPTLERLCITVNRKEIINNNN